MNHIKIAFFDIDGTLRDLNQKTISPKTIETIQKLQENHVIVCVATGRTPVSLPEFPGIHFDAFLTFNGSYCFNQQQVIFTNPIPQKEVQTIIRNATSIHRPVSIATRDRLAANGQDQDLLDYYTIGNIDLEVCDDFDEVSHEEIFQIMLGCREQEYDAVMKDVEHAKITAWWDRAVDIISADGGKGKGVEKVLEFYHLKKEDAIAFGDGNNDIEMLQTVGHGVAMANASEQLKEVADDICGHVAEDGIYHYCLEHGLIQ